MATVTVLEDSEQRLRLRGLEGDLAVERFGLGDSPTVLKRIGQLSLVKEMSQLTPNASWCDKLVA